MKDLFVLFAIIFSLLSSGSLEAQTFRNPIRIPTTQDPVSIFTVDVNVDGVPDILYEVDGTLTAPSSMDIFFGQPSGGFIAGPTFTLPTGVGGCRPVDANNDGKLDLACLHLIDEFDAEVAVFLGNGDGTFQAPIYGAPMQSAVGFSDFIGWIFTPADLTGNGIPDLLVGDSLDEWIFVLLGDGTGRFAVKSILGGYPDSGANEFPADAATSITVADLNGDGKPDLLFSSGPTILLGNGDGTFKAPATYVGDYFSCVYRDMDGDGHLDAVCANLVANNELAILHGNADGSFNTTPIFTQSYVTSNLPEPVAILDLNGDGIPDIVADSPDGLEVLLGKPGLEFANPVHYAVGYPASNGELSSQLADMNQDGNIDVVAAGPNGIYISYGNADGAFNAPPAFEVAQVLGHATLADFNGDGIPDIAATGDQSIELSLGNGDGTFKPFTALPNGGIDFSTGGNAGDAQIVHGDFRGIGKQDILAIGSPSANVYNSYIFFGNGDGTFASPQLVPGSGVIFPVFDTMAVIDINNDGRDDILTSNSGYIYSALSNGNGTFTTVSTAVPYSSSGMAPIFPAFADFNHDGKLDAAYAQGTSVYMLKGHGDGTFDSTGAVLPIPAYEGASPQNPLASAVGDFDGDGNPDIALLVCFEAGCAASPVYSPAASIVFVYYGNGDGTFSSPVVAGVFNRVFGTMASADVNKDGLSDLLLQTNGKLGFLDAPSGDGLGVLLSKPGRAFGPEVDYTGGQVESALFIADLNGDGYPDLLVVNSGYTPSGSLSLPPNTVTTLLNLGAQATAPLIPTTTALASSSNPATAGGSITFTATVSSSTPGNGAPTGSVVFADQTGINALVPLVAIGSSAASASLTTSAIGIGSDVMSATYSGDTVFSASQGLISQTVTGNPVTIAFTATPNPATAGQTVVLNATVANSPGSSAASPTGSVSFSDGASPLAGPIILIAGAAAYNATFSAAGVHALTASYSGDALHVADTATLDEQVLSSPIGGAGAGDWTWMGGSSTVAPPCPSNEAVCGLTGVYGALGVFAAGNFPGGRTDAASWTDSKGNFWLFGGDGFAFPDSGVDDAILNDLWEFNPSTNQWAWMGGSNQAGSNSGTGNPRGTSGQGAGYGWPGVYGALGNAASGNIPGSRFAPASWTDGSGNLWLFGGSGLDANNTWGLENDLWEFSPSTLQWAWMGGSSSVGSNCASSDHCGQPGVYGMLGMPAAGNVPGGRLNATWWTDQRGNLWLFGGQGVDSVGDWGLLNDLWEFNPSTKEWAWMGGSSTLGGNSGRNWTGQAGVYGTLDVPAQSNTPGGRNSAAGWTDSGGNLWLLGGNGVNFIPDDLWEYNTFTNEWTWVGGTQSGDPSGVYGVEGAFAPANMPGARVEASSWTDKNGNLWLFGGDGFASAGDGNKLNDLWEYSTFTGEWAWMGGSTIIGNACAIVDYCGWPGVYGTEGEPAAANNPGSRSDESNWTDSNGNFWLFGGTGFDGNGNSGSLYDLWVYQPVLSSPVAATPTFSPAGESYATAQSVTISDTTSGAVIYYTTNGTAPTASSNVYTAPITVSSTEIIEAIATASGYANSPVATAAYTFTSPVAATPTFSPAGGSYATAQSVSISDTTPGAVIYYTTNGTAPTTSSTAYSTPIPVSSTETIEAIVTATGYATSAVATVTYTIEPQAATPTFNVPAGTYASAQTVTISDTTPGAVIYYTTDGATPTGSSSAYSAPISVSTSETLEAIATAAGYSASQVASATYTIASSSSGTGEWTWMGGSSTIGGYCNQYGNCGPAGVYGTLETPAARNIPGGRSGAPAWTDRSGNFWLFGGQGFDAGGDLGELNDLWEFDPFTNQWTWMGGSSAVGNNCALIEYCGQAGVYGTLGTAASGNVPGGRSDGAKWTDSGGHLWLLGGYGYDANGNLGDLNDLWEFDLSTNQWAWVSGSSTTGAGYGPSGVYGTLGTPAPGNMPGARQLGSSWTDSSGHLWLFAGLGVDANGNLGELNDVWEFTPSTKLWAWMGGTSTIGSDCGREVTNCGQPGVYGTLGTPAAGNIPGSRESADSWTDNSGHLWIFGGLGFDSTGGWSALNDLWEFNSSTNQWTWFGGSSTIGSNGAGQPAVFGTLGVPSVENNPGGLYDSACWIDGNGHFWLFGGWVVTALGSSSVNGQWEFDPSTNAWTWWGGGPLGNEAGVYGTLGIPAAGNFPGARGDASSWTDSSANAWLFGGGGVDANDRSGFLNDLWTYRPLPSLPAAATPTFNPPAGTYATAQTVTISDTTPGATIYYTTNGTTPTASSNTYSTPISVSSTETIEAIATATGYSTSNVGTAIYTIAPPAATPTFSVPAGSYVTAQTVTISDTTPGAVIYYTTNGTTPTASSNVYSTPIVVSTSEALEAIATATNYSPSQAAIAAYTITASSTGAGDWTWMGGSSTMELMPDGTYGQPGVYGILGTPAAGNIPGGRTSAVTWTDAAGNLWLFGGNGKDTVYPAAFNDLWKFSPSTNEWAWMSGSNTVSCQTVPCGQPGVYGTLGTPAAGNTPGGRNSAVAWTDPAGNLWLFGGVGLDANGKYGYPNDLWEFNPSTNLWTWMGGNSTVGSEDGQSGVYGKLGVAAPGNTPGGRVYATSWTDSSGHFWLFGGGGPDANGKSGYLNDLWDFNPSTNLWAWMGGSSTVGSEDGQPGVYGTLGTPAAGNVPGGRWAASSWSDSSGNLWLFGGGGFDSNGTNGLLNDLWELNPSTSLWRWMGGSSTVGSNCLSATCGPAGVYGTLGTPAAGNVPGGRWNASSWADSSGHLWLFGGEGYDSNSTEGNLNDLWEFNLSTNEWVWMGGSNASNIQGVYGSLGVPASGNDPGARTAAVSWIGISGGFWLYGGYGFDSNGNIGFLDDLWIYGPAANLPAAATPAFSPPAGAYATAQTVTISDTTPGATIYYTTNGTTPTAGSSVYGAPITVSSTETIEAIATATGYSTSNVATAIYTIAPPAATPTFSVPAGTYSTAQTVTISDTTPGAVIYYTTNGTTPTASSSVYGAPIVVSTSETLEAIATATNYSPSQVASAAYTITASSTGAGDWTWMGGSSTVPDSNGGGFAGMYGTMGTPSMANIPGSRQDGATTWTDVNGNLWLFGGGGCDAAGNWGSLNDLWKYDISTREWTWVSGSSTLPGGSGPGVGGQSGVYGVLGVPAAGNVPGGRAGALGWTDASGNLWLFGGVGRDSDGIDGYLNDLWKFNPSTSEWTWMAGSSALPDNLDAVYSAPGVYGTLGVPAPGNTPGGRIADVGWTDRNGNFWLFGAGQYTFDGLLGALNDLWEFNPSTGEWTWMSGSNAMSCGTSNGSMQCTPPAGVYGSVGVPAAGNTPGSRALSMSWVDGSGNLWLFGGISNVLPPNAVLSTNISWNDLWEFNPLTREWAWMGGSSGATNCITTAGVINCGQPGVYGALGVFAAANSPGGRTDASGWTDDTGNFWLFGGQGPDSAGDIVDLNSFWEFNPSTNEWAWVGGSSAADQPGVYGTLDVPAAGNIPGARTGASAWTDNNGNFWLFGGWGYDSAGIRGYPNDLWRFGSATSNLPVAATPTFSVPAGTYATAQTVTISDTTPGETIYYTTNGTTPTAGSSVYSAPITVSFNETIEAIATATGYVTSAVASASYTLPAATTTTLTASSNTLTIGQTLTLTATVTPAGGATPAGTVTFYNGAVSLGAVALNSSGAATLALTPAIGNYSITASYGGSSTDAPSASSPAIALTVSTIGTATALTASSNALTYGQTLTLTATVTPASGATPTGTVTFYNGAVSLGTETLNSSGVATLALTPAVGNYSITANYGGSADDAASASASIAVNVTANPTTTTLTASPNPAPFGAAVTFTATVSSSAAMPGGNVSFYDGSVLLTTATLASGVASYSTSALSVGSHTMTAAYAGGSGFSSSTSNAVAEVISPADFSISASPSEQSIYTGQASSYSVTITPGTGFNLPVALSCTQAPANTTCTFSPATVSGGSGSSTLTVQTAAPGTGTAASVLSSRFGAPLLAGILLLFIPRRLRRYRNGWLMFLAILAFLAIGTAISGCSAPGPLNGGTPAGSQTVAITGSATNGSQTLNHTTTVTLNVKSLF